MIARSFDLFWRRDYQSREACAANLETRGTDSPTSMTAVAAAANV